jgi:hypothetical protein
MRISNRNYPIFENVFKKDFTPINGLFNAYADPSRREFNEIISKNLDVFNESINVVSSPFFTAVIDNLTKIKSILSTVLEGNKILQVKGTFIINQQVVFCNYSIDKKDSFALGVIASFTNEGYPVYLNSTTDNMLWTSPILEKSLGGKGAQGMVNSAYELTSYISIFKEYADVETKMLKPHSKLKEVNCKYSNDTKHNLCFLDSKWFTNLVKSDAFKVRGHFRLQACGEGYKDRKLIWINDFQKNGYTAPARIITS